MKAEQSQIPVKSVKPKSSDNGVKYPSSLYAMCRRLQAEVNQLKLQLSTARRDINRLDKKLYRDPLPSESVVNAGGSPGFIDIVNSR